MRIRRSVLSVALAASLLVFPTGAAARGAAVSVTGGGWFLFAGTIPIQLGFGATVREDGTATGTFHQSYEVDGLYVKYWGRLTCLTYDATAGRAWIGGVLTKVSTNDPEATQLPGEEAWFRVLDGGPSGDRSTTIGFVPLFPSSAAYCAGQPWPDDNARTHPVTSGQISISAVTP
jgi:hypothetical protein